MQTKSNTTPRELSTETRKELAAMLRAEMADKVLAWLEALVTPSRVLPKFATLEKPTKNAKPIETKRRLMRTLNALKSLEQVAPYNLKIPVASCRMLIETYGKQDIARKGSKRTESARMLSAWVGKIWPEAARDPDNKTVRRHFAITLLTDLGLGHPGSEHPKRLDAWLDAEPLGWATAQQAIVEQMIRES